MKIRLLLLMPFFAACGGSHQDVDPAKADSLSRAEQRLRADSLRKTNPLLIVPPDSTYTGDYVDRYPSGIVKFRGQYRFGQRHGHWRSFFSDGSLWSEMEYDKGLRHGVNIVFNAAGNKVYEGWYKNDKKDSIWTYYDSTGAAATRVQYRNDRIINQSPMDWKKRP